MPTPTGFDYLSIRYIQNGTHVYANSLYNQSNRSASFSGSESLFHAESSSNGTYTWDSSTGNITLNHSGNYFIQGTIVGAADASPFPLQAEQLCGYMGLELSGAGGFGSVTDTGKFFPQGGRENNPNGRMTTLGAKSLQAMSTVVAFGPNAGLSTRGDANPRSQPYQMFITGATAGMVIRPVFACISQGAPNSTPPSFLVRNLLLEKGTTFTIRNFPDETLNQSYAFSSFNITGTALDGTSVRYDNINAAWWGGDYAATIASKTASFGFDFDPSTGFLIATTSSFFASPALVSANLTDQKYLISSIEGLGGSTAGGGAVRWGFQDPDAASNNATIIHQSVLYTGSVAGGAGGLQPRVASKRAANGFTMNVGVNAFSMIDVPNVTMGLTSPRYGFTSIKPATTVVQTVLDLAGTEQNGLFNNSGGPISGSSFALIPMAPYSDEAKSDSYFSLNVMGNNILTGLGGPDSYGDLSKVFQSKPVDFPAGINHINLWAGNDTTNTPVGGTEGFTTASLFQTAKGLTQDTPFTNTYTTFGGGAPIPPLGAEGVLSPANILTSSGITPEYEEGKLTVNHDGMYVITQNWNSINLSSSAGASGNQDEDIQITIRKNATSGSSLHPSGNYLAGGEIIWQGEITLDRYNSNGYGGGFHAMTAFTASANDYITCDISSSFSSMNPAQTKAITIGGSISLAMYRIGNLPGVPYVSVTVSGSGFDLFNRDLSVINRYSITNQYTTSYASASHQVPYVLGSRGITTLRDRDEPPAPKIGRRDIIRKKRR